jgi:heptosyltransferase-2
MNILIIKTGALGDVVRTTFIAQALKDKYKENNPKIFWFTNENVKIIFVNNVYVDKVISEKKKDELKKIDFDIVINLEEGLEEGKFASSLNCKEIIGFIYKNGKILPTATAKEWFDMSILGKKPRNDLLKKKNKKTHRQIISEIVGIKNYKKYEPFLRLTENQRKIAKDFLRRYHLSRSDLIVGINTSSSGRWPRELPIKKTVNLIEKLYKKLNAKILLFGGPNEIERNKEILRLSKIPILDTGCGNDLLEFPALISVCNLFITSNSLGLHIALSLKRKVICFIGPTSSSEIDMYGLGEKVIAKSNCLCCYKSNCKSMEKIDIKEVMDKVEKIIKQKITVLITSAKEQNLDKAIEAILNQKTNFKYEIIIVCPDEKNLNIAKKYAKKDKRIKVFQDTGEGKVHALNSIFPKIKTDILILTDGDVQISDNALSEISNMFLNQEIGCVTGKTIPIEDKRTKYGYWANFLFDAAHKIRKKSFEEGSFVNCTGYLYAIKLNKVNKIPLDTAEDGIIPYYLWEKGYKIGYAENAKVYVKNANNLREWLSQKIRTSRAHENLSKYVNTKITPNPKTFKGESKGIVDVMKYPQNFKEMFWSLQLILFRLCVWLNVFNDIYLKKRYHQDVWKRVESSK